ncbi:MAG: hypothetical protein KIS76_02730 [Pyrinomonadaceae bacterium]|nr:hypothetical protein [Pyrinomonadaceae bacterium]
MKFDARKFQEKEFRKSIFCEDERHNFFVTHHNSKIRGRAEHSHLEVLLEGERSLLEISYHSSKLEDEGSELEVHQTPTENVFKLLGAFFEELEYEAQTICHFTYDTGFKSVLQLNYPVLVNNEKFKNSFVSGYEISLADARAKTILISSLAKGINIIIGGKIAIRPSVFNYLAEVEYFGSFANSLVERED